MNIIYKNKCIVFLILISFFKPICLQYYSEMFYLEKFFIVLKIISAIAIFVESFEQIIKRGLIIQKKNPIFWVFLYDFWILLITYLLKGDVNRAVIDLVSLVALTLFSTNLIQKFPSNVTVFLRVFSVLLCFQLISELLFPNGMPADLYLNNASNPLFFCTLDNGTTGLTCLFVFLIEISDLIDENYIINKWTSVYFPKMIAILTAFFSGSSTAVICTLSLVVLLWLLKQEKMKLASKKSFWISLFVFIVYSVFSMENSLLYRFIIGLTGKSGFSGRYYLWGQAINMICESPFVGYGRLNRNYLSVWGGYFSSHNMILELLLQGGMVALFIFVLMMICYLKIIGKNNDMKIKKILFSTIFVVLTALMMEQSTQSVYLFTILGISAGISKYKSSRI